MNVLKLKVSDDFNELKKNHIKLTPISTNLTKNRFIRKKNVNK